MQLNLTQLGAQMSQRTGVRAIMQDIIETLRAGSSQTFINLSAGNPVILPAVEQLWRDCTAELLASPEYGEVVCRYGSSQGYAPLIDAIARDFNQRYSLQLSDRNILITPGSQALYFYAGNAFGGRTPSGEVKSILLPLSPDYTGYGGLSLTSDAIAACKPTLEIEATAHRFKYRPDFSQLAIDERVGCLLFSRPCNPSGNLLTDAEVQQLAALAAPYNIPVIVDSAYAAPYPALNYAEMTPQLGGNLIHGLSLSKAGLPGERLGIAIAAPEVIDVLESFQTNLCIHSPRYGQAIAARAIASGELARTAETVIRPHYREKLAVLETALDAAMPAELPWYLHRGEGGIFAWLWFPELPTDDWEFYQQLKQVGVIVVPGSSFFPGLREDWPHKRQCLRVSLTATRDAIATGMERLARVAAALHRCQPAAS